MLTNFLSFIDTHAWQRVRGYGQIYQVQGQVALSEILFAEERLGVQLPASYKLFLQHLGWGLWSYATIPHPAQLQPIGADFPELRGYIALFQDVLGAGDGIYFASQNILTEGESPLYYFDAAGNQLLWVADSFDECLQKLTLAVMHRPPLLEINALLEDYPATGGLNGHKIEKVIPISIPVTAESMRRH